ncbi:MULTISPECIES: Zn-dependent hydrolase [unclassified Leptolyngbya]|uniref:Zn-dependent hydrolase n=1 Tax=unclassified Leptolyngbya TaxID=2650499 RepID=UPI0016889DE3|nr:MULTISPECIES: Zn-dependent hydrolase [unclassified Leptolyngbya]MBD1912781.1 Zn-dependent hydrolase [Leptolyngbya sp. FACHB-8]MBD2157728.1 Zn-dependent hydrolase [Leptolyngbya sp. FACHB-16]
MAVLSRLGVNGDRLMGWINRLAKVGRQPNGDICRLAFTQEDLQARYLVQQWMMEAGLTVRTDAAGNLIGTYAGLLDGVPALATGSHIDTVPSGGAYDGVLGVLAGIEVVKTLQDNQVRLKHPLEVIVFTDEESSMVGARSMAGLVPESPADLKLRDGLNITDCLEAIGGNWEAIKTAKRGRDRIAAFVELHVEQGAVLERAGKEIGVVQGIVGMRRSKITILGQANHAGTTPMDMRQDALVAAAQVVLAVRDIALVMPGDPVATVGYLTVAPNAANIVPGQVELTVDIRDLSQGCMDAMQARLEAELRAIATATDTTISTELILFVPPSPATDRIQATIAAVCEDLHLSSISMPSRAGHDAMEMGRITDMGMIFVPSQQGLSHSGREYTPPEQCIQGANVLLQTFLRLDEMY